MHDLLDSRLHLACVIGPDAGLLIALDAQWRTLGRGRDSLRDRQTSRQHCRMRVRQQRRGLVVEIDDLGSLNGVYLGSKRALLPGFARDWIIARRCRRARASAGSVVGIGANVFEVRALPGHLSFDALAVREPQRRSWRAWLIILPFLSLTWLLSRLAGWWLAGQILIVSVFVAGYVMLAYRSRHQARDPIGIVYGALLQSLSGRVARRDDWLLDLTPARRHRHLRVGSLLCVVPRRQRKTPWCAPVATGARIGIRTRDSAWLEWILTQLCVAARGRGIDCTVSGYRLMDGEQLLFAVGRVSTEQEWDTVFEIEGEAPCRHAVVPRSAAEKTTIPTIVDASDLPVRQSLEQSGLRAWIGADANGPVAIDLVEDGPHALVAGTTGSGKSEALRTWIFQLARAYDPSELRIIFVDYKGGATFRDLAFLPHGEGVVTDLDSALTERAIAGLSAELIDRERIFANRSFSSLSEWEQVDRSTAPPRILCVIDEFRAMIRTHPGLIERFIDVAARGRSLGIHLIAATQSPAGVVSPHMRANLTLRICLRTAQVADSVDVIGTGDGAAIPRIPGRALINESGRVVQWARLSVADVTRYTAATVAPPTLWKTPLPARMSSTAATGLVEDTDSRVIIGVADDIDHRCYRLIALDDGLTYVVGARSERTDIVELIHAHLPAAVRIGQATGQTFVVDQATPHHVVQAVRIAAQLALPVLIDDLTAIIDTIDSQVGVGAGREWWRTVAHQFNGVLVVGIDPSERFTTNGHRSLITVSARRAKTLGWGADIVTALENAPSEMDRSPVITSGWEGIGPLPICLIEDSASGEEASWHRILGPHPFDFTILSRLVSLDELLHPERNARDDARRPERIRIIGAVPSHVSEVCRELLPMEELREHEMIGGIQAFDEIGVVTIVGDVSAHIARSLNLPIGLRAGTHLWAKWNGWWYEFDKRPPNVTICT
ncbi:MAG: FtsK/SpoIIIE domain-containing protein [Actinomycetaceae bacterium]|nr:FtsK/SpoIIIE domain-containing protein [Actinomycetaceae bacterium]